MTPEAKAMKAKFLQEMGFGCIELLKLDWSNQPKDDGALGRRIACQIGRVEVVLVEEYKN